MIAKQCNSVCASAVRGGGHPPPPTSSGRMHPQDPRRSNAALPVHQIPNAFQDPALTNHGAHSLNGNTVSVARGDLFEVPTTSWFQSQDASMPSEDTPTSGWADSVHAGYLGPNIAIDTYTRVEPVGAVLAPGSPFNLADAQGLKFLVEARQNGRDSASTQFAVSLNRRGDALQGVIGVRTSVVTSMVDASELDRLIKRVRGLMGNINPGNASTIANALSGARDEAQSYAPLFARVFAMAEAWACGAALAAPTGPAAVAAVWPVGAVGAGPDPYQPLAEAIDGLVSGGVDAIILSGVPTVPALSPGALRLLWNVSQPNCGILPAVAGQPARGVAGMFPDALPVWVVGPSTRRPNVATVASAVWGDFTILVRWLMHATGSENGVIEGLAMVASRVRFEGPEHTHLAVPMASRFEDGNANAVGRFRAVYELGASIGAQQWTPWMVGNVPGVTSAQVPHAIAGMVPVPTGALRGALERAAASPTFAHWECTMTTTSARVLIQLLVGAAGIDPTALIPGVPGAFQGDAVWITNRGRQENVLTADGVQGDIQLTTCSGLSALVARLSGTTIMVKVPQWRAFPPHLYLKKLYGLALLRRAVTDTLVYGFRASRSVMNACMGAHDTGSARLDLELAQSEPTSAMPDATFLYENGQATFCSLFGVVGSIGGVELLEAQWPVSGSRLDHVMPVALSPQLRGVVVDAAVGCGGSLTKAAFHRIAGINHKGPFFARADMAVEGLAQEEAVAVMQVAAAVHGLRLRLAVDFQLSGAVYPDFVNHSVVLDELTYCRVSDESAATGSLLQATVAYCAVGYPRHRWRWHEGESIPGPLQGAWGDLGDLTPVGDATPGPATYGGTVSTHGATALSVANGRHYARRVPILDPDVHAVGPYTGAGRELLANELGASAHSTKALAVNYNAKAPIRHFRRTAALASMTEETLAFVWRYAGGMPAQVRAMFQGRVNVREGDARSRDPQPEAEVDAAQAAMASSAAQVAAQRDGIKQEKDPAAAAAPQTGASTAAATQAAASHNLGSTAKTLPAAPSGPSFG